MVQEHDASLMMSSFDAVLYYCDCVILPYCVIVNSKLLDHWEGLPRSRLLYEDDTDSQDEWRKEKANWVLTKKVTGTFLALPQEEVFS